MALSREHERSPTTRRFGGAGRANRRGSQSIICALLFLLVGELDPRGERESSSIRLVKPILLTRLADDEPRRPR